jgi:hypothetical protein
MQHWGLILMSLAAASFTLLAFSTVTIHRLSWARSSSRAAGVLPDFAIVDCGESVHLVPVESDDHQVDNTGRCACSPVISINRRRSGTEIRYVDHHAGWGRSSGSRVDTRSQNTRWPS